MRYKLIISYDGTNYNGYATQPTKTTIQDTIEAVLIRLEKRKIRIIGASRTDSGVHAHCQVVVFDSEKVWLSTKLKKAMNANLPDEINVEHVEEVSEEFHPRYHAKYKVYRYYLNQNYNLFNRNFEYYCPYKLDVGAMQAAIKLFEGTHDFTAFSSVNSDVMYKVRTIYHAKIIQTGSLLTFEFCGNGFLYNMVRILVGTLISIGQGKLKATQISELFLSKERDDHAVTAPARGLFLEEIGYTSYQDSLGE
ncbi:MAG: tRNA pseudouridine(38-40) synthase TruA [Mycoplasmatales bacterium]